MARFHLFRKALQSEVRKRTTFSSLAPSRSFSQLSSPSQQRPSFGIAFDIDGVILLGNSPVGGSPAALRRLYDSTGRLRIPYVFLTNGGGFPEAKRASELSQILGINISPAQVLQGHSPFRQLASRFENELVVAAGKGEPAAVMSEYGFKNVLTIDEYASCFEHIDPLAPYKKWTTKNVKVNESTPRNDVFSERVQAAFIVSDPVDWSRDIQVLCDILKTGGLPGRNTGPQPSLYFANDDLEYQNAEIVLRQLVPLVYNDVPAKNHNNAQHFKTLYMIGDNPAVDIRGARQTGHPWFSILTRTGVFKGKENHHKFPADLVVDSVEEAVDYILTKECKDS